MLVSDYTYDLPEERIAKFPPKERGTTRLLVLDKKTGALLDSHYRDLADFLEPGDVLIMNDTRVMHSRLFCTLPDGRKRELVVLEKHGSEPQRVMYRGKLHEGDVLTVDDSRDVVRTGDRPGGGPPPSPCEVGEEKVWQDPSSSTHVITIKTILEGGIAEVESAVPLADLAEKYGSVPLPPYLHRDATAEDQERYQTVWAKNMGSAAAPTASLNMTDALLEKLRKKGVIIRYLTLHVGLGTFLPIRTDKIEEHKMHSEWYSIPEDTLSVIKQAKAGGSRVVSLGTTVARTLEYYARTGQPEGEDDIFIYPGFEFKVVDALLTNFHAPKSTVLMLASAFAGWENLRRAYQHAIEAKYNFLSYGDSMLIISPSGGNTKGGSC
ncbi:MAG: tRNA preQ1(34) S-adenosylmethionine ribosyltransferase-isomerase QueA [Candidatus Saccharibacteria bacterium]|nr:tRNA preQ1(34) S-adenosylmethionine ribosyltransferase-isomerase QueA [Candidatus Saccharibacteria bacterium]